MYVNILKSMLSLTIIREDIIKVWKPIHDLGLFFRAYVLAMLLSMLIQKEIPDEELQHVGML